MIVYRLSIEIVSGGKMCAVLEPCWIPEPCHPRGLLQAGIQARALGHWFFQRKSCIFQRNTYTKSRMIASKKIARRKATGRFWSTRHLRMLLGAVTFWCGTCLRGYSCRSKNSIASLFIFNGLGIGCSVGSPRTKLKRTDPLQTLLLCLSERSPVLMTCVCRCNRIDGNWAEPISALVVRYRRECRSPPIPYHGTSSAICYHHQTMLCVFYIPSLDIEPVGGCTFHTPSNACHWRLQLCVVHVHETRSARATWTLVCAPNETYKA